MRYCDYWLPKSKRDTRAVKCERPATVERLDRYGRPFRYCATHDAAITLEAGHWGQARDFEVAP